jgi:hypothetical protein
VPLVRLSGILPALADVNPLPKVYQQIVVQPIGQKFMEPAIAA